MKIRIEHNANGNNSKQKQYIQQKQIFYMDDIMQQLFFPSIFTLQSHQYSRDVRQLGYWIMINQLYSAS